MVRAEQKRIKKQVTGKLIFEQEYEDIRLEILVDVKCRDVEGTLRFDVINELAQLNGKKVRFLVEVVN